MENIVTTKEKKMVYDISVINRAFYMVEDAIRAIEDMDLDMDTIIKALGLSIKIYDHTKNNNDNEINAKFWYDDNEVSIYNYAIENKNELTAEAVILILIYRSMCKEGIEDFSFEDIKDEDFVNKFKKRVEALASRLLIPKKEFSDKIGEIVYYTSYNEQRGEEQLLSVSLIRKLLIEKLMKKYDVTEHMANVRLSVADLGDGKYDPLGTMAISEFKRSYFDSESTKEQSKTKK